MWCQVRHLLVFWGVSFKFLLSVIYDTTGYLRCWNLSLPFMVLQYPKSPAKISRWNLLNAKSDHFLHRNRTDGEHNIALFQVFLKMLFSICYELYPFSWNSPQLRFLMRVNEIALKYFSSLSEYAVQNSKKLEPAKPFYLETRMYSYIRTTSITSFAVTFNYL